MKTIRTQLGRIGKMAWYLSGAVLVLCLPTFSYLIPRTELVMSSGTPPLSGEVEPPTVISRSRGPRVVPLSGMRSNPSAFASSQMRSERSGPPRAQQSTLAGAAIRVVRPVMSNAGRPDVSPGGPSGYSGAASRAAQSLRPGSSRSSDSRGGGYAQDLSSFEQGYQAAMGQLFQDYGLAFGSYPAGNPFDDALPDDDKKGDGDSDTNGGDTNGGDTNGGDTNGGQDNGNQPPPNDDVLPPAKTYPFLLVGDFEEVDSKATVFRGYRYDDGGYVLENGARVNPFPGMVGLGVLPLSPNEQVVSDDFNGDGRLDLLVIRKAGSVGTEVELWLRDTSGNYREQVSGLFLWKTISSIGLFDFDKDDDLDLAILFGDGPNLFIYTVEEQEFKYLKEIVLPFEPSVVVDSVFEGFPRERRLYVFDRAFYRVATFKSRNPGVFVNGLAPAQNLKSYKLDGEEDGPGETYLEVFEDSGGIALAEKRGAGWVVLGRFSTTIRYPVVVFGDYSNTGARQILCLP